MANTELRIRVKIFVNDLKINSKEVDKVVKVFANEEGAHAEDLLIRCARELEIGSICRHLFGFYIKSKNQWLSLNQKLSEINTGLEPLEFRLRFKPYSLDNLKIVDKHAFNYYFYQMRYDFLRGRYSEKYKDRVLGLVITDILRYIIEQKIPVENAFDKISMEDFLPSKYINKRNPFMMLKAKEIKKALVSAWHNAHRDADYVKQEFIESLAYRSNQLMAECSIEKYSCILDKDTTAASVEVRIQPYDDGVSVRFANDGVSTWVQICSIAELCFISVQPTTNTAEISRRNGIPRYLSFPDKFSLRSFVSCLDGYYRLSEKWSYSICKEIFSISLAQLRAMRCHGPVRLEFSYKKLKEKSEGKVGTFILRESFSSYDEYKIDVIIGQGAIRTFKVTNLSEGKYSVEGHSEYFTSINEVVNKFETQLDDFSIVELISCLPPSEYDKPGTLLLCRNPEDGTKEKVKPNPENKWPLVIPNKSLNFHSGTTLKSNALLKIGLAKLNKEDVIVKIIKSNQEDYLETLSNWIQVKSDSIVNFIGVTLHSPLALVMEYHPHGPLDSFLSAHQQLIKVVDLIESVLYVARALWHIQEHGLAHGRIRCHNFMVSVYDPTTLRVKLTDPITDRMHYTIDEGPWLAPECKFDSKTTAGDVWAFGTTLWEVFTYGSKPKVASVEELSQPIACPDCIWSIVEECWNRDPLLRRQPQSIVRDISQILYEVYNSRQTNTYSSISYDSLLRASKKREKASKPRPMSFGSASFRSTFSSPTTTLPMGDSYGPMSFSADVINDDGLTPDCSEPWIIEANQLELGNLLGKGNYGEVVKAVLKRWAGLTEEEVAVKRIHQRNSSESVLSDMRREFEIMKGLNHKNIIQIKGFVEEPQIMLVMEFVKFGSLLSYLKVKMDNNERESVPLLKFALDIAEGMEYLESKSIIHRDLAARNVLVQSTDHVKISDFGLAQHVNPNNAYYKMQTQRSLPLKWYAPEILKYFRFTHKSDIWSYGVTLWEMYTFGEDPTYPEAELSIIKLLELLENGVRLSQPDGCPLEVYQLMYSCWNHNYEERPSFTSLKLSIQNMTG